MLSLLKNYPSEFEPVLNHGLMDKTADAPLVDFVIDSWKSLEVVKNIKIVGYEYTDRESEINTYRKEYFSYK